jgi:hypothetical protein
VMKRSLRGLDSALAQFNGVGSHCLPLIDPLRERFDDMQVILPSEEEQACLWEEAWRQAGAGAQEPSAQPALTAQQVRRIVEYASEAGSLPSTAEPRARSQQAADAAPDAVASESPSVCLDDAIAKPAAVLPSLRASFATALATGCSAGHAAFSDTEMDEVNDQPDDARSAFSRASSTSSASHTRCLLRMSTTGSPRAGTARSSPNTLGSGSLSVPPQKQGSALDGPSAAPGMAAQQKEQPVSAAGGAAVRRSAVRLASRHPQSPVAPPSRARQLRPIPQAPARVTARPVGLLLGRGGSYAGIKQLPSLGDPHPNALAESRRFDQQCQPVARPQAQHERPSSTVTMSRFVQHQAAAVQSRVALLSRNQALTDIMERTEAQAVAQDAVQHQQHGHTDSSSGPDGSVMDMHVGQGQAGFSPSPSYRTQGERDRLAGVSQSHAPRNDADAAAFEAAIPMLGSPILRLPAMAMRFTLAGQTAPIIPPGQPGAQQGLEHAPATPTVVQLPSQACPTPEEARVAALASELRVSVISSDEGTPTQLTDVTGHINASSAQLASQLEPPASARPVPSPAEADVTQFQDPREIRPCTKHLEALLPSPFASSVSHEGKSSMLHRPRASRLSSWGKARQQANAVGPSRTAVLRMPPTEFNAEFDPVDPLYHACSSPAAASHDQECRDRESLPPRAGSACHKARRSFSAAGERSPAQEMVRNGDGSNQRAFGRARAASHFTTAGKLVAVVSGARHGSASTMEMTPTAKTPASSHSSTPGTTVSVAALPRPAAGAAALPDWGASTVLRVHRDTATALPAVTPCLHAAALQACSQCEAPAQSSQADSDWTAKPLSGANSQQREPHLKPVDESGVERSSASPFGCSPSTKSSPAGREGAMKPSIPGAVACSPVQQPLELGGGAPLAVRRVSSLPPALAMPRCQLASMACLRASPDLAASDSSDTETCAEDPLGVMPKRLLGGISVAKILSAHSLTSSQIGRASPEMDSPLSEEGGTSWSIDDSPSHPKRSQPAKLAWPATSLQPRQPRTELRSLLELAACQSFPGTGRIRLDDRPLCVRRLPQLPPPALGDAASGALVSPTC